MPPVVRIQAGRQDREAYVVTVPNLKANAKEAVASLLGSKQRSLLALIGIVIGIASVIAMLSVGAVAKQRALEQFRELGTDYLAIGPEDLGTRPVIPIRLPDALGLSQQVSTIAAVAPWIVGTGEIIYAGTRVANASIVGITGSFSEIHNLDFERGRDISDMDFRRYYCVVGARIASSLRRGGADRLLGQTIRIGEHLCTIIGVALEAPRSGMRPLDIDRSVLVPFSTAQRMFPESSIQQIAARMTPDTHHAVATEELRGYFRRQVPGLNVWVNSAQRLIDQMQRQMQTFALLLAAIGSISMIVGGIGVMNVMLVSVTERRREIGVRRALGARRVDIQSQFLTESIILSLVGGVLGIALGVGGTWAFCRFVGWTFLVDPSAVAMGVAMSFCVGVFFGIQPAAQAARLDPITALRAA